MSKQLLTEQQKQVVQHPLGKHARVLAVAGSGKTTTMVHRINYLIHEHKVSPGGIFVVMFNKLARIQFKDKLVQIGLPLQKQPQVHTFHSCAYRIIKDTSAKGLLPEFKNMWLEDREEQSRYTIHRAIFNLENRKIVPLNTIDPEEAMEAIAFWKNSLIPPDRAGHKFNAHIPLVYAEFERLRIRKHALTYDDFVPIAVGILESEAAIRNLWCNRASIIIVDEYQDVNHGQQRMLELMAGNKADVMVVGDDDQTIYEWRGARPYYILEKFETVFSNKPHALYQLPHSFRFGPVIAQCAQNVIDRNLNRIEKPLIAHAMDRKADLHVFKASVWQQTDPHLSLARQVKALVRETNDPLNIIVLGRTYSQLNELEAVFLQQKIPYRVVGSRPFFERREIQVLLDYFRLAMKLEDPVSRQTQKLLLSVANTPNRKLSRDSLVKAMSHAHQEGKCSREALIFLLGSPLTPLTNAQRKQAGSLLRCLEQIREKAQKGGGAAGGLLNWLVDMLSYLKHFDDYYGKGEHSEERKQAVLTFCSYAHKSKMNISSLLSLVDRLDTTRGVPEEQQIVMTSVFRTKGLEYDYVIIPNCTERYMPCRLISYNPTYDKAGLVREPLESEPIDNERRLFYVALTRARKAVYIGTTSSNAENYMGKCPPSGSRFLDEMVYEPTVEIMSALQGYATGTPEAERNLLASIAKNSGIKSIINNLESHYLKGKEFKKLGQKIRKLRNQFQKKKAEYSESYLPHQRLAEVETNPFEEKPWWMRNNQ